MMTHRLEKPYQCTSCDETFKYKNAFLKHKKTHTLDKPYQCSICNKTYSLKSSLMNHLRTHREKTTYHCSSCERIFTNKKVLESHLKTHTGEKTYKCSICDKDYISRDSLMRHLKTHNVNTGANQDKMQNNLKRKRVEMYDAIKCKKIFNGSFTENEVLDACTNFREELQEKNKRDPACSICKESWFNAFRYSDGTICGRCQREKPGEKECYTFSEENGMIPGPIPNELEVLNDIEEASIKLIKPFLHIYKRKGGGVGFKGNCISFAQDVKSYSLSLPCSVQDLPIVVIQSVNDTRERRFCANANKIRNALKWLKINNPEYKDVTINEDALKDYPENGGELKGISTFTIPAKNSSDEEHQSLDADDGLLQDGLNTDDQGDLPRPDGMVFETLKRPEVSNMVKEGISDKFTDPVAWPEIGAIPEKELQPGFFRKVFPKLFPYGRADITCSRWGKKITYSDWVQHLLKADRRYAKDPLFVMVVTNIMQRQQALTLSNIYADKRLSNLSAKELKENLEKGDSSLLKSMYYFSKGIKGSQQFFSTQSSMSYNLTRHLRIDSDDKEMFNVFLTFSLADLHEDPLHKILPNSHLYLNKTIFKDLNDVPPGTDMSSVIDEKTDYQLRSKAINENIDIVNEYFINKIDLLWKHVLKPIFGGENYIRRYEFQHRGSIHCHMVMSVKNGPSCGDMELANEELPNLDDCQTDQDIAVATDRAEKIKEARIKMTQFTSYLMGISAIHPETNPSEWPAPHGQNIYKPAENVLRSDFEKFKDDPVKVYKYYTSLINRCMLHKCKMGYCLDQKRVKVDKSKGPNGEEVKKKTFACRFNHPMEMCGFEYNTDENGKLEDVFPKLDEDGNLKVNGSVYEGGLLTLLRNHPDIVTHIPELLVIWGANTDQKVITAYQQLLNYLLKYIMKNETQSDFFTNVAKTVIDKLDDEAPIRKSVQKILLNSVGQRDMSINECMLICHNQPYVDYSKTPRLVNLRGSNVIKNNISTNDEGITSKDNWQEAYWQRESCPQYQQLCKDFPNIACPKNPKNIALREFVVNFTKKWKYSPSNVFPHFIPSYKYIVHKGKPHYEEFCKNLLLMDKPGCTLENVGELFSSFEEELKDFVENSEFCPNLLKKEFYESQKVVDESKKEKYVEGDAFDELYLEVDKAAENAPKDDWMEVFSLGFTDNLNKENEDHIASDDDASDYDVDLGEIHKEYDWQTHRRELKLTDSELKEAEGFVVQKKQSTATLTRNQCSVDPCTLNTKQKKAYKFIEAWIDSMEKDPENTKPIYLNISGRAGCGKTYFLNCVAQYAKNVSSNFLLKAAPTGTAAFLIGGDTLHSMFKLPLQVSTKKDISDLSLETLNELQAIFKNCKILVIDEKSMVGLYMMYQLDKRLKEIKSTNSDLPFGGISVVLMGDFAQLPPVGDKPMFTRDTKSLSRCQSFGKMLFVYFDKTIIFDEIMRQQGDDQKTFREVLDRLADGSFNEEEYNILKQRNLMGDGQITEVERNDFLKNATLLCAYNKDLISHNISRIKDLGTPIAVIKSRNSDQAVARILAAKAHGLPSQIMLAKGCKVILTSNLWKEAGLTNGAKGEVKYIVYDTNVKPKSLPNMVIVQFPQYIGPSYLENCMNCVPIVPIRRDWYSGKKPCWRIMLPLKPAYGTTIHSSQGQSLDQVIINLGKGEFSNGLTYTAISRCKKIENLSFNPMPGGERFRTIYRAQVFKDRRVQDKKEKEEDEIFDRW